MGQHSRYDFSGNTPVMDGSSSAQQRYRLLLDQLRDEEEGRWGWKTAVGKRLGVTQPHVSQILAGTKLPGLELIERAMRRLRIHRDFFFKPELVRPQYRDFVGLRDEAPTSSVEDTATWVALEEDGTVRWYVEEEGVSEAQVEHVRRLPNMAEAKREDYLQFLEDMVRMNRRRARNADKE